MCKKTFMRNEVNEENCNFIVSNVILGQTEKFTYEDIINKLKGMFDKINSKIEYIVKSCLIRLSEDGFLSVLGSSYLVVDVEI